MPNPGNFNPEWGYLAPKPGFIRSARMALAAGAIGVLAGMAVAVVLIAHPSADVSVAARTMAQSAAVDASPTLPTSPVSAASAELLESDHVTTPQVAARTSGDPRDVKNFTAAESHSAATTQRPAGVSALAEAPAVNDNATETPSGPTPLSSPKKLSKVQQPASVAALAAAPALRDDASQISNEALAPSPKKANKKVQTARVRTPRNDPNVRDGEKGGPLDFLPLIGRTILGANWNDQGGRAIAR